MAWERQEPHRHAGSGAQKRMAKAGIKGVIEGGQQAPQQAPERDRTRWTCSKTEAARAAPGQRCVLTTHCCAMHVRNSEVCTFETAKCARSKQRSAHVRNSEVRTYDLLRKSVLRSFRMRKARLVVSPKPREARADQERLRRPPGRSPRGRRLGKSTPATSPRREGRSWASRPSRCACRCASLDPHPSGSAPQAPARASGAFSSEGRVKGLVRPRSPVGARTRPLDATGATQACRQGVGRRSSPAPLPPRREGPGRVAGGVKACGAGGTPCRGFKGARSPLGLTQRTKPSAEGEHFCSSSFALRLFMAPRRGLNLRQKGNPGKPRMAGFGLPNVISQDYPVVSGDYIARGQE